MAGNLADRHCDVQNCKDRLDGWFVPAAGVHSATMDRLQRLVLGWVMSISVVLLPYSTLHAHVSDPEHTHVHGGHVHDFDSDHDVRPVDQVVKISIAATTISPASWD